MALDCTFGAVLAAVVVTFSADPSDLARCVDALCTGGGVDRVLVFDTGGTAELPERPGGPPVELVRVANRGYGAAANAGFARAEALGADRIALLNDDVVVRPGWATALLEVLESEPVIGAVQPALVTAGSGTVNSLGVTLDRYGAGHDVGDGDEHVAGAPRPIRIFTGGAVLFRRGFLADTGGFDERWFLYYEDVDLALRGAARGWEYRVVPEAVVEHARGATAGRLPERTRYLQERNRLWNAFRHADAATVVRAVWLSVRRLRHRPRTVHLRALVAGLAGGPRRLWERRGDRSTRAA